MTYTAFTDNVVTLTTCLRNPSRHAFDLIPDLHTIWKPELSQMASRHSAIWESSELETGQIFIASYLNHVIGITGWYQMTETEAGLRWHGVLPKFRKNGYSKRMIELVCSSMPESIKHVYEVTRNPNSCESFQKSGFEIITEQKTIDHAVWHADYDISNGGFALRKSLFRDTLNNDKTHS